MFKSKRTKIFSVGLVLLLLCSLATVPTVAEGENLFVNPEFSIDGNELVGWAMYGSAALGYPTIEDNVITSDDLNYDENAPVDGNIIHIATHGHGIRYKEMLPLNENGVGILRLWYKSSQDRIVRFLIDEYDSEGNKLSTDSTADYLPNTNGKWHLYEYIYSEKFDGKKISLIIRVMNYNDSNFASDGNLYFMAPSYSTDVPMIINGNLENNSTLNWANVSETTGSYTVEKENDGNHYLKITAPVNTQMRTKIVTSPTRLLEKGDTVKITFKFKQITAGAAPRLDIQQVQENGTTQVGSLSKSAQNTAAMLGTISQDGWTEYILYFTVSEENTKRLSLHFYAQKNETAETVTAYDEVTVELAENNAMIYQNGVETSTLTPGVPVSARYHNVSNTAATFVLARYSKEEEVLKLEEVILKSAPAGMTTVSEDVISEISNPVAGDIIKAFALNGDNKLTPVAELQSATAIAASATE